jgi:uncharacterized membrane protein
MRSANPQAPGEETVFDAVLYPHRSLGRSGFRLLLFVLAAVSTLICVPFYLVGAWPVVGFFGLDVLLVSLFFRLNYRAARLEERVLLTNVTLFVSRIDPRGRRRDWSFNPLWVRLRRDEHAELGLTRLALVERNDEVEIAGFLGAAERTDFANALAQALALARRGPRYD